MSSERYGQSDEGTDVLTDAEWPLVSVLFVSYKRMELLRQAILTFRANTDYPNVEVVIADDGSPVAMQAEIRELGADRLVLSPVNTGLGSNINRGMAATKGEFILMIQDDWRCEGPPSYLRNTIRLMERHPEVGMVGFTLTLAIAHELEALDEGLEELAVIYPDEASRRDYPFLYSDQPHVRRRAVNEIVGSYLEGRSMVKSEKDYERRWEEQRQFRTAMFPRYVMSVFSNQGTTSSHRESRLTNRMDRALMPFATKLRRYPLLFAIGRALIRAIQQLFD